MIIIPLSVLPEYQNRGIGQSLIKQGHIIAQKMGYKYSVVLGHEKYYPKSGYVPASQYGIKALITIFNQLYQPEFIGEYTFWSFQAHRLPAPY